MATAYTAAAAATATAVLHPRLSCSPVPARRSAVHLPVLPLAKSFHLNETLRFASFRVRASSNNSSAQSDELVADLKEKWDALENKSTVLAYGGGAIVALWLSSVLIGAINSLPLLPKILELVGLGYTGWFIYRYLLFKESRKELATDVEALKKRIAGTGE